MSNKRFYSLVSLVNDMIVLGEINRAQFPRFLRAAARATDELQVFAFPNIESKLLTVDNKLSLKLPPNCIEVYKCGFLSSSGHLRVMRERHSPFYGNSEIDRMKEDQEYEIKCCVEDNSEGVVSAKDYSADPENQYNKNAGQIEANIFHNFNYGISITELYGSRPVYGQYGYWYEERAKARVWVGGYRIAPGAKIVVEYKAAATADLYKMLPVETYQVVRYKALHMLYETKDPSLAQTFWNSFLRHKNVYDELHTNFDVQAFVDALRGGYTRTPKR